jgi:hypothetical protein
MTHNAAGASAFADFGRLDGTGVGSTTGITEGSNMINVDSQAHTNLREVITSQINIAKFALFGKPWNFKESC